MPHTNDLTALALTNSSLHAIVTPLIYSRFDIVWPDALNLTEPRTGVDALTYGLATLVMREDIFENAMLEKDDTSHGACQSFACKGCGGINYVNKAKPAKSGRLRRGNFFSQFTKKFSLGNGPADLVQEYLVTKEGGKMLGTLVALSIARMPNLETFIWDMPTGILRDIWISLASLGDYQPSNLQKIFIRFHNNKKALEDSGLVRSSSAGTHQYFQVSTPISTQTITNLPFRSRSPMETKIVHSNHHVETPNFSILPPLRSITAIAIDELANLDELSVLVEKSADRLRELRVGMAPEVHTSGLPSDSLAMHSMLNRGPIAVLFSRLSDPCPETALGEPPLEPDVHPPVTKSSSLVNESASLIQDLLASSMETSAHSTIVPTVTTAVSIESPAPELNIASIDPALTQPSMIGADSRVNSPRQYEAPNIIAPTPISGLSDTGEKTSHTSKGANESAEVSHPRDNQFHKSTINIVSKKLKLDTIELERHTLNIYVLRRAIDWSFVTSLTLLQCADSDRLWWALRTEYAPLARPKSLILSINTMSLDKKTGSSSRLRRMPASPHSSEQPQPAYRLNLKHIQTNTVSASLLALLKETLAPNTLQSLFLQDHSDHLSAVSISQVHKGPLKRHRGSLTKLLLDSAHGPINSRVRNDSTRKWMLNREILTYITSPGKMPKLRELSASLEYKDWHFFLQQLPNVRGLRSLHIPFIADHVYGPNLSLRELAMGVVDVINLRQECQLAYLGVGAKCFEVIETKVRKAKKKDRSGPMASADGAAAAVHDSDDSGSEALSVNTDIDPHHDADDDNDHDHDDDDDDDDDSDGEDHPGVAPAPGGADEAEPAAAAGAVDNNDEDGDDEPDDPSSEEDDTVAQSPQIKMKLREILFYDDKIAIFKARHGRL